MRGMGTGEPKRVRQEMGGFEPHLCPARCALAQHSLGEVKMRKNILKREKNINWGVG